MGASSCGVFMWYSQMGFLNLVLRYSSPMRASFSYIAVTRCTKTQKNKLRMGRIGAAVKAQITLNALNNFGLFKKIL